ncbi:hypothetical protein CEUSTIGMA_g5026.t1 [Chlamydomonas eustigma]|uniref:DNA-directed RNA polymerase n=1 Tax=Chlamydomonas eustigma TaxID=1157962 RepID=A0A250X3W1_9CHLO|nr:hypothetical protein CEUSTIGMA_g5026.t1 [Chlamydomonas eustigma]|eukprot:GAX77582.1 hypothetical protein CEUSTIGMA_g5026.t1 [Chlamydomonas eustigma]
MLKRHELAILQLIRNKDIFGLSILGGDFVLRSGSTCLFRNNDLESSYSEPHVSTSLSNERLSCPSLRVLTGARSETCAADGSTNRSTNERNFRFFASAAKPKFTESDFFEESLPPVSIMHDVRAHVVRKRTIHPDTATQEPQLISDRTWLDECFDVNQEGPETHTSSQVAGILVASSQAAASVSGKSAPGPAVQANQAMPNVSMPMPMEEIVLITTSGPTLHNSGSSYMHGTGVSVTHTQSVKDSAGLDAHTAPLNDADITSAPVQEITQSSNDNHQPGFIYPVSLEDGYKRYLKLLNESANRRQRISYKQHLQKVSRDLSLQPDPMPSARLTSASFETPSFEKYSRTCLSEMRARDSAWEVEVLRVKNAAQRGSAAELPSSERLLWKWGQQLNYLLKKDQNKIAKALTANGITSKPPTKTDTSNPSPQDKVQKTQNSAQHTLLPFKSISAGAVAEPIMSAGPPSSSETRIDAKADAVCPTTSSLSTNPSSTSSTGIPGGDTDAAGLLASPLTSHASHYYALLFSLPTEVLASVTIEVATSELLSSSKGRMHVSSLSRKLGECILDKLRHNQLCAQLCKLRKERTASLKLLRKVQSRVGPESVELVDVSSVNKTTGVPAAVNADSSNLANEPVATIKDHGSRTEVCTEVLHEPASTTLTNSPMLSSQSSALDAQLDTEYKELIEKANKMYETADKSIGRMRYLAKSLGWRQRELRSALVRSVDRILDLQGWTEEDSVRIGSELLHALTQSASVEATSPLIEDADLVSSQDKGGLEETRNQHVTNLVAIEEVAGASPRVTNVMAFTQTLELHGALRRGCHKSRSHNLQGFVELNEEAAWQLKEGSQNRAMRNIKFMPMLIPPRPWTHFMRGGPLTQNVLISRAGKEHEQLLAKAHKGGQLNQAYTALTDLGEMPWRVNNDILSVIEQFLSIHEELHTPQGIPNSSAGSETFMTSDAHQPEAGNQESSSSANHSSRDEDVSTQTRITRQHHLDAVTEFAERVGIPPLPGAKPVFSSFLWNSTPFLRMIRGGLGGGQLLISAGPPLRSETVRQRQLWETEKSQQKDKLSLQSFFKLRLHVANELRSEPRFYYPHNTDFRGRAYPLHPYLHHMGDDLSRGLLTFAESKPLGQHGLDWLLVHVANLWGKGEDKKPTAERRDFARRHLKQIFDSALHPLRGISFNSESSQPSPSPLSCDPTSTSMSKLAAPHLWWTLGEKPWQLLAACFEVHRAMTSERPEEYHCSLPVHQDGSCNGLQHYAALARDRACAASVNMLPADRPQDVYSTVAKSVEARVKADAEIGRSEAIKILRSTRLGGVGGGGIDRKLVKQTVMTSVYGVTYMGARIQIGNRLSERGWTNEAEIFMVSQYLAGCTFQGMGEVFSNANAIKKWLSDCAKIIVRKGRPVFWTNPVGFPVVQPYRLYRPLLSVNSSLQRISIEVPEEETNSWDTSSHNDLPQSKPKSPINKRAQTTAFSPNYIHSIDSSHMMLTALECRRQGIAFAGVHDSFWTHAGSVPIMSSILRDTFVSLHSRPLLEKLAAELQQQLLAEDEEGSEGHQSAGSDQDITKSGSQKTGTKKVKKRRELKSEAEKLKDSSSLQISEGGSTTAGSESTDDVSSSSAAIDDGASIDKLSAGTRAQGSPRNKGTFSKRGVKAKEEPKESLPKIPSPGDLDLREIYDAEYFFS